MKASFDSLARMATYYLGTSDTEFEKIQTFNHLVIPAPCIIVLPSLSVF